MILEMFGWKFEVDKNGGLVIETNSREAWLQLQPHEARKLARLLYASVYEERETQR